ncbi:MAG: hypothetical protein NVS4B10_09240 [Myxococcales bacterium]
MVDTLRAIGEVVADHHLGDPQSGEQLDEALGRGAREGRVEGLHHQGVQALGREQLALAQRRADQGGRELGREQLGGVRPEGERGAGAAAGRCEPARELEQGLVPAMDAVEVADGDAAPEQGSGGGREPGV